MLPLAHALPNWDAAPASGITLYSDRLFPPEETVARVWPHLPALGITRVARQTGLDRIGIPTWAAFRPNSRNLASSQGKGLTDAAACASAVMEAVEIAIAEVPDIAKQATSAATLTTQGAAWFDPSHLLPPSTQFDEAATLHWVEGRNLQTGSTVWVPLDAIDMNGEASQLTGICKTSNGLASGNTEDEATFHALCELIERDGATHWSVLDDAAAYGAAFEPAELRDAEVDRLVAQLGSAGLRLRLFNQTVSDLGVPVIMAVIGPDDLDAALEREVAAGYGAHPVAARAALRAITEAAQSRVTSVAASRDDIDQSMFTAPIGEASLALLSAIAQSTAPADLAGERERPDLPPLLAAVTAAGIAVTKVTLNDPHAMPFAVVRLLAPELEDRDANLNWRPGRRIRSLLS